MDRHSDLDIAGLPTKRVAADYLILDTAGSVLLIEPTHKDTWDLPGGVAELEESPREAARREVQEEVGLRIAPGRLLAVDWVAGVGGVSEVIALVFDGGVLDARVDDLVLQPDEASSAAYVAPSEIPSLVDPEAARRIAHALAARGASSVAYLENGHPVSAC